MSDDDDLVQLYLRYAKLKKRIVLLTAELQNVSDEIKRNS